MMKKKSLLINCALPQRTLTDCRKLLAERFAESWLRGTGLTSLSRCIDQGHWSSLKGHQATI
jgi:hypothetical protein